MRGWGTRRRLTIGARLVALVALVGAVVLASGAGIADARPLDPGAAITDSCAEGGAAIDLVNPDDHETTFVVMKGGEQVGDPVVVPAGEARHVVAPLDEGEQATFRVLVEGVAIARVTITHHCLDATATITHDCADDGARVLISNGGAGGVEFVVTSNGVGVGGPIVLGPGGSAIVTVPVLEDHTAEIVVTADGTEIARQVVSRDCQDPGVVAIALNCARGGAVVDLRNDGVSLSWVELRVDGLAFGDLVAIPGNGLATAFIPLAEDSTHTISVVGNGVSLGEARVTKNCVAAPPTTQPPPPPPEPGPSSNPGATPASCAGTTGRPECQSVLGVKLTRDSLVSTGVSTKPLTATAGLLLLFGGLLVAASSRPTRPESLRRTRQ
jgi:hypothetical protein